MVVKASQTKFNLAQPMKIDLGDTAVYLRETRGLTQRAAAELLGITPVHLCNIEKGNANPSRELLSKYREVLGADLYVLAWCRQGSEDNLPMPLRSAARALRDAWANELGLPSSSNNDSDKC